MQNPEGHHAGDLPNLIVSAKGKGTFKATDQDVTLAGDGPTSLFRAGGTSVVIHEKADDMKTDPAGNAGARIACGVIQKLRANRAAVPVQHSPRDAERRASSSTPGTAGRSSRAEWRGSGDSFQGLNRPAALLGLWTEGLAHNDVRGPRASTLCWHTFSFGPQSAHCTG